MVVRTAQLMSRNSFAHNSSGNLGDDNDSEGSVLHFSDESEDEEDEAMKQQQEKTFHWYHRLGRPTKKQFMKRVRLMLEVDGYCEIQPTDVERLPWTLDGKRMTMATPRVQRKKRILQSMKKHGLRDSLVLNYHHQAQHEQKEQQEKDDTSSSSSSDSDSDSDRQEKQTQRRAPPPPAAPVATPLKKKKTKKDSPKETPKDTPKTKSKKASKAKKEAGVKKEKTSPQQQQQPKKKKQQPPKQEQPKLLTQKDSSPVWAMDHPQNDSTTSMSSTITVDHASDTKQQAQDQPAASSSRTSSFPLKRKVRFETFCQRHDNTIYSCEDIPRLWLTLHDYKAFKKDIVQSVLDLWAHEDALLEEQEHASKEDLPPLDNAMPSYLNIVEQVYQACADAQQDDDVDHSIAPRLQRELRQVFDYDAYIQCVGLEKHAVETMVDDKVRTRKELNQLVNQVQDDKDNRHLSDEALLQRLRQACVEHTRPQRLFALYMAKAQND